MTLDLSTLNSNQRQAVEWNGGPLLVLAGPGSGKTRVLTMRIAKLISESPGKRFRILGLTFTNKAAAEMRTRVEEMVPASQERVLLTTFHSFSADILRQHGSHQGITPEFAILNQEADREAVLADAIQKLTADGLAITEQDIKLLPLVDRLLTNCIAEDQVAALPRDPEFGKKLAALYSEYRKQLISHNRLDFSSLLLFAHKLLVEKPFIAKQFRTVFTHICVDEFQDTNLAQYNVLQAIVGTDHKNLFVVADDDQIIYQWNGASPERLQSLQNDYSTEVIQLPANYRCPPEVIDLANKLIRNNLQRSPQKEPLCAMKQSVGESIRLVEHATVDDELRWVARDIATRHRQSTGDCVVLARTRKLLEQAVTELTNQQLEASLTIRKTEFTSAPLRWLHAVLRLANARGEREQLRRLCKAFYELEGVNINVQEVIAESSRLGNDYLRCWFEVARIRDGVGQVTEKFLASSILQLVDRMEFLGFITSALDWFSKLEKALDGQQDVFVDFSDERATWDELQQGTLNKYGREDLTLNVLLQEFDLSEKSPPVPPNAVRCLTIHTAKGMEFKHVYLVGMAEDQLPSFQSIKKGDESLEMQEERRNCFVAITRTLETLTLTYANKYFGWPKEPSRFLREMELLQV